jgi:lysophospholipase L1-like esterase
MYVVRKNRWIVFLAGALCALGLILYFALPRAKYTYLALGDSYTVGYKAGYNDDFPTQTAKLLRSSDVAIANPRVVGYQGWTTGQLLRAIDDEQLKDTFTFVSLLIGTNNQFGSWGLTGYTAELEELLQKAVHLTGGHAGRVLVLSLPDYSRTRYAAKDDTAKIAAEMRQYNDVCKSLTHRYNCTWIDITSVCNSVCNDPSYYTKDGLHPSGKGYALWAAKLADAMQPLLPQKHVD